jgi:hypothetical protein
MKPHAFAASVIVPPCPFLKPRPAVARIEDAAWALVLRCCEELGLHHVPLPVPVEQWIERPLGYTFSIADLSRLGDDVLGATFVNEREIVISDRIRHEGRLRFTCAHELGHMTLHAGEIGKQPLIERASSSYAPAIQSRKLEWEADRFAAAFLMPMPVVAAELVRVCESSSDSTALAEIMRETPRARSLWLDLVVPGLCETFGVSATALVYRFEDAVLDDGQALLLPEVASHLHGVFETKSALRPQSAVPSVKASGPSQSLFQ